MSGAEPKGEASVPSYDVIAAVDASKKFNCTPGETLRIAEELAIYGLRTSQISRLTGLPEATTTRIAHRNGAMKTGREKRSIREIFRNPRLQATTSSFLFLLRDQMEPSEKLTGGHILAAAQIIKLRNPSAAAQIDWERMCNAAFMLCEGKVSLSICNMCGTCNLHEVGRDARNCVLCRLGDASTEHHGPAATGVVTPFRVTNCRSFPTEAPKPAECRQRILSILS